MGFHVFPRAVAAHFGGYDAGKIFFKGKLIYKNEIGTIGSELENAAQPLIDFSAPVKSSPRYDPANENRGVWAP